MYPYIQDWWRWCETWQIRKQKSRLKENLTQMFISDTSLSKKKEKHDDKTILIWSQFHHLVGIIYSLFYNEFWTFVNKLNDWIVHLPTSNHLLRTLLGPDPDPVQLKLPDRVKYELLGGNKQANKHSCRTCKPVASAVHPEGTQWSMQAESAARRGTPGRGSHCDI